MPLRILIAEEHEECCQLFRMFLQRCGYDVTAVHDGVSCIEAMNTSDPYDVLILSWELPWGEGEAILDWVRFQGIDNLAVIVLTARMNVDDSQEESALPRVTWIQRPFSMPELLDAVESTERVPFRNWRCLESLIRKSAMPLNGVVFDGSATTQNPLDGRLPRRYRAVQPQLRYSSDPAQEQQSVAQ